jgi:hypothetical protein
MTDRDYVDGLLALIRRLPPGIMAFTVKGYLDNLSHDESDTLAQFADEIIAAAVESGVVDTIEAVLNKVKPSYELCSRNPMVTSFAYRFRPGMFGICTDLLKYDNILEFLAGECVGFQGSLITFIHNVLNFGRIIPETDSKRVHAIVSKYYHKHPDNAPANRICSTQLADLLICYPHEDIATGLAEYLGTLNKLVCFDSRIDDILIVATRYNLTVAYDGIFSRAKLTVSLCCRYESVLQWAYQTKPEMFEITPALLNDRLAIDRLYEYLPAFRTQLTAYICTELDAARQVPNASYAVQHIVRSRRDSARARNACPQCGVPIEDPSIIMLGRPYHYGCIEKIVESYNTMVSAMRSSN